MDIPGILQSLDAALQAKSPQAVVAAWKVGQRLNASVVSAPQHGQATINIHGALLLAQTNLALKPGQVLQLEVTTQTVMTVLKALSNAPGSAASVTLSLPPQPQLLKLIQSGQALQGLLSSTATGRQASGLLELAGQRLPVQLTQVPAQPMNQTVKLEVVNPGRIAKLKILTAASTADAHKAALAQALRNTLPQQAPLLPMLKHLAQLAKSNPAGLTPMPQSSAQAGSALPQAFIQQVRALLQGLPRADTVSRAEGLKQAVAQSGLFFEARLAQSLQQPTPPSPAPDFKSGLLGLLLSLLKLHAPAASLPVSKATATANQAGTHTPGQLPAQTTGQAQALSPPLAQSLTDLLRTVESGLARIQLSQLVSSAPEDDGKRSWAIELPVRNGDNIDLIQLRIEKDPHPKATKKTEMWTFNLALSLSELGPMQAKVSLANKIVHTHFWAENSDTVQLIDNHLVLLDKRFRELGLSIGTLKAHHGTAPVHAAPETNLGHILLDEKA